MKSRFVYYLLLTSYFFKTEKIAAINRKSTEIDPISDFRTPFSLNELLREGLIDVSNCLNQIFFVQDADGLELLTRSQITISAMIDSYDAMNETSNLHAMYRDDRDYLQTLIDRIDAIIQDLQRCNKVGDQDSDLLHQNIESLNVLKSRLQS
jgi:hypothetical protein